MPLGCTPSSCHWSAPPYLLRKKKIRVRQNVLSSLVGGLRGEKRGLLPDEKAPPDLPHAWEERCRPSHADVWAAHARASGYAAKVQHRQILTHGHFSGESGVRLEA